MSRIGTAVEVLPVAATLSPEWHEARRQGISASEIAAVLGLSPWESPYSLWHRKVGTLGEQDENQSMRWGRRLEDAIAEEFAERHPEFYIERAGLLAHESRDWQLATPDRVLYDSAVIELPVSALEVKTDGDLTGWGDDGSDEVPVYYRCQVLWQMDVIGIPEARIALLLNGRTYREYTVSHDEADLAIMRTAAQEFLQSIRDGAPPDVDAHTATTDTLKALHPDLEDRQAVVPDDLADAYHAANQAAKDAKTHLNEVSNLLRDLLGSAKYGIRADGSKVVTRSVYDVAERVQKVEAHTVSKLIAPRAPKAKDIA